MRLTIGVWVFCTEKRGLVGRENAFFEFFLREVLTTPPPGSPHIPQRWRPQPSAPRQTEQHRQQGMPCQMQGRPRHAPTHTPKRWTRCTGLLPIPDKPRRDDRTVCGALDCLRNVSDRARPNGQKNKTYKYVIMLRVQLDKNVNIRYNIGTT